jgi:hypothetical protein
MLLSTHQRNSIIQQVPSFPFRYPGESQDVHAVPPRLCITNQAMSANPSYHIYKCPTRKVPGGRHSASPRLGPSLGIRRCPSLVPWVRSRHRTSIRFYFFSSLQRVV